MSNFWSGYIMVLVTINIALCAWLLMWTSKMDVQDAQPDGTTGHEYDGIKEYNNPLPRWWYVMFWLTIVFAVGYLIAYPGYGKLPGVLGWSSHGAHAQETQEYEQKYGPLYEGFAKVSIPELAKDERAMQIGARLFGNNCAACHGTDAHGARGFPNLTDNDWIYGGEPDQIKQSILKGRNGMMPAWGEQLGEQGVKEVVAYTLSLSGRDVDQSLLAKGKEHFVAICATCHTAEGTGNPLMGGPNLTDGIWLYGSTEQTVTETVTHGRNGVMPAWEAALGEERVHLLAAYVWSLSNK